MGKVPTQPIINFSGLQLPYVSLGYICLHHFAVFLGDIWPSMKVFLKGVESVFGTLPITIQWWLVINPWDCHFILAIGVMP